MYLYPFFELVPDAMLVIGTDGAIKFANAMATKLFGYSDGELVGMQVEELMPARYRERHVQLKQEFYNTMRTRPMGHGQELQGLRRDGTEFPLEISLSPVDIEGSRATLAAVRDISDRIKAQDYILRLHAERDALVGNIAHQLNNPLQSIAYVLHLLNTNDQLPPKARQHIAIIGECINRIAAVSRQLLQLQASDCSRKTPQRAPVSFPLNRARIP